MLCNNIHNQFYPSQLSTFDYYNNHPKFMFFPNLGIPILLCIYSIPVPRRIVGLAGAQMKPSSVLYRFLLPAIVILSASSGTCGYNNTSSNPECHRKYHCGNIQQVTYPFMGGNRPYHCGRSGFKLRCRNNKTTTIYIADQMYRVLQIDQDRHLMQITRDVLLSDRCFKSHNMSNSTLDPAFFRYSSQVDLSLYYNCPSNFQSPWNFTCSNGTNSSTLGSYFVSERYKYVPSSVLEGCSSSVTVSILPGNEEKLFNQNKTLREALLRGFVASYDYPERRDCEECMGHGGVCVFEGPKLSCDHSSGPADRGGFAEVILKIFIGIGFTIIGIMLFSAVILTFMSIRRMSSHWKQTKQNDLNVAKLFSRCGSLSPKRYKYSDVKKMTSSFRDKLGQGGCGCVYKGELPGAGRLVAVKILDSLKGKKEEEFINEVASISQTSHVNVISLLGFCWEGSKRALIYEYLANGSLERFIYDGDGRQLELKVLYAIGVGIARGLMYLHVGCSRKILHFDIKPHNILLDESFRPKISDFGLAKLYSEKESFITIKDTRGTAGYIAPEVFNRGFGEVSDKSDVYSYGMMMLEMVGGQKNVIRDQPDNASKLYFPHWVYNRLQLGDDLGLQGIISKEEMDIAKKMVVVGLWCIQPKPADRPSIRGAIEMLEGSLSSLEIPPEPFMYSPDTSPANSCSISFSP